MTDPDVVRKASALAALGVVFGDIGTSPLYAFRAALQAAERSDVQTIIGIASLIFWALTLVVTLKYLTFILREDNRGEGGILALAARLGLHKRITTRGKKLLLATAICGAALLFGDAVITPAISVLSAVEGLADVSPSFASWDVLLTVIILLGLFAFQTFGTARISRVFGPLMLIWFVVLAASGIPAIVMTPEILRALSPGPALTFATANPTVMLAVIAAVFLAVTGAEALYADLGQFGRASIGRAWIFAAFPALTINYFGQGALLISQPEAAQASTFYALFPITLQPAAIGLATLATIIASQAVITGLFSLAHQAIAMGLLPPLRIIHKNTGNPHDVFLPAVNAILAVATIAVVVGFQSSAALTNAYGVAVSGAMVTTTILYVAQRISAASVSSSVMWPVFAIGILLLALDGLFVVAGSGKFLSGGAVPLALSAFVMFVAYSWRSGQTRIAELSRASVWSTEITQPVTLEKTAVFLTRHAGHLPRTYHELHALPGIVFFQSICVHLSASDRPAELAGAAQVKAGGSVTFVDLPIGFMEAVNLPKRLSATLHVGDVDDLVYIMGSEHSIPPQRVRSALDLMLRFYCLLERLAGRRADRLGLPPGKTIEFSTIWQL